MIRKLIIDTQLVLFKVVHLFIWLDNRCFHGDLLQLHKHLLLYQVRSHNDANVSTSTKCTCKNILLLHMLSLNFYITITYFVSVTKCTTRKL